MTLTTHLRGSADGARTASPLTAALIDGAAADLDARGPTVDVFAPFLDAAGGAVVGLRFAAAVHRLVLERRAGALALHYPTVGGTPDLARLWADAVPVVRQNAEWLARTMATSAVQTNEVGRSAPLLGGLVAATGGRLPVRLLEVGASGGLNLRPDRIAVHPGDGSVWGDPGSPLRLDACWSGPTPTGARTVRVIERAGCDPHPVDLATTEGRLHLSSFVWADQLSRWERLRSAFALAAAEPVTIDPTPAPQWLAARLVQPVPGVLTVVWHSIVWQYVNPLDRALGREVLAQAAARATTDTPLALLVYESRRDGDGYRFDLLLRTWPGGAQRVLASGGGHGIPLEWRAQPPTASRCAGRCRTGFRSRAR